MAHYTLDNTQGYTQDELDALNADLALDVLAAFMMRPMLGKEEVTDDELAALVTRHHTTVKGWRDAAAPQ